MVGQISVPANDNLNNYVVYLYLSSQILFKSIRNLQIPVCLGNREVFLQRLGRHPVRLDIESIWIESAIAFFIAWDNNLNLILCEERLL